MHLFILDFFAGTKCFREPKNDDMSQNARKHQKYKHQTQHRDTITYSKTHGDEKCKCFTAKIQANREYSAQHRDIEGPLKCAVTLQ